MCQSLETIFPEGKLPIDMSAQAVILKIQFDFGVSSGLNLMAQSSSFLFDEDMAGKVLDAMLPMLRLHIDPPWRAEIIDNIKVNARMAQPVLEFPLEDELDAAPVFKA